MSPVVALPELPEVEAGGQHRPVHAARELVDASEQRLAVHHGRDGLDDPRARMALHQPDEVHHGGAGEHAVGVAHDHVVVVAAPAPQEVRDVPALALDVVLSQPVEDAAVAAHGIANLRPRARLFVLRLGITRVAQEVEVEGTEVAGGGQRPIRRLDAREHATDVLVGDRDDDRRARAERAGVGRLAGGPVGTPDPCRVPPPDDEPDDRRPETE